MQLPVVFLVKYEIVTLNYSIHFQILAIHSLFKTNFPNFQVLFFIPEIYEFYLNNLIRKRIKNKFE